MAQNDGSEAAEFHGPLLLCTWMNILWRAAGPLKVRFTLSKLTIATVSGCPPLDTRTIISGAAPQNVDELIGNIKAALPEATVFRDEHNPEILHIVESSPL